MATGLKVVTCLRAFCSRTTERALIRVVAGVGRDPVEGNRESVVLLRELTGAPGRELEDARAAETSMGDEHGAVGLELRARRRDRRVLDRDAREVGQSGIGDMEGEERRDRRDDRVAEGFRDGQAAGGLIAAGGDDDAVEFFDRAVAERELEVLSLP
jgi:hypothetical protein